MQTFPVIEKRKETFYAHSIIKELLVVKMSPHTASPDSVMGQDGIRQVFLQRAKAEEER